MKTTYEVPKRDSKSSSEIMLKNHIVIMHDAESIHDHEFQYELLSADLTDGTFHYTIQQTLNKSKRK